MPLLRAEGIVLHAWDLGEHDRLVTLYTRDHGRFSAVARGARRLRSRFSGALELFTWGDAVGFEREGRGLVSPVGGQVAPGEGQQPRVHEQPGHNDREQPLSVGDPTQHRQVSAA